MSQSMMTASTGTFRATDSVRVRAEPSTDAAVITVVHTGDSVEMLDHDPAGWSRVQVGGSTGYIRSDFLKFPVGSSAATFKTTDGVNLRATASTNSEVLKTVVKGTNVEVQEHDPAGWSKVSINGTSGYIRSDFLTRGGTGAPVAASASSTQAIATLRTTGTVNIRSESNTDSNILKTLVANSSVEVLENLSNGWSKVRHSGTNGFIRSDLISSSSSSQATSTRWTTDSVNLRSGGSTSNSVIKTIASGASVEVLENQSNGWSKVRHNDTDGFIKTEFLSNTSSAQVIATLKTVTGGVRLRSGPSTTHNIIKSLSVNTSVDILENQSNGWSRVRHNGTEGFIRSDLLGSGARPIELIDWETAKKLIPKGTNLRVVDVRTGISYNIKAFSLGNHADVDTATQADTDAKRSTRGGVWAWAPRPVWVTVGERTFAASINGMPHAGSSVSGNGLNGHFCLHFRGSTSHGSTSASYVRNMQNAITEAWEARPQ